MRRATARGGVGDVRTVLLVLLLTLTAAASAQAASVAYVYGGSVWLSSLDGAQKVKLAGPVVNASGETEQWLDVAQSDGGRIVAVRNKPGRISSFSWFKIWEPDGSATVEGPLNARGGFATYTYPLGFDITADGAFLVYGYSNAGFCCPIPFERGTYVRPATNSTLPAEKVGKEHQALLGRRMIATDGAVVAVQNADAGNPFTTGFTPWLDTGPVGLDVAGVDVAATGSLVALDFDAWSGGTQTTGKVAVISIQGLDTPPAFPAAVDCFVPAQGIAGDASLSPDATRIAWADDGGVKVAGTPTTAADPCVMTSAPVVISPTGGFPSIGGADVGPFLPRVAPPPPPGPGPGAAAPVPVPPRPPGGTRSAPGPAVTLPAKVTVLALRASGWLPLKVRVACPGTVAVSATVPARTVGRRGRPVVVATGRTTARRAGSVTVRVKLNRLGRKRAKRLKGVRATLKVTHGARTTTKAVTLR